MYLFVVFYMKLNCNAFMEVTQCKYDGMVGVYRCNAGG